MTQTCTLPAGDYFLGDPCYSLSDKDYDLMRKRANPCCIKQKYVARYGTFDGDGSWRGSDGAIYAVDSGHIGLTDLRLCPKNKNLHIDDHPEWSLGRIYTFVEPVLFSWDDGRFEVRSGETHIVIDTHDDWSDYPGRDTHESSSESESDDSSPLPSN